MQDYPDDSNLYRLGAPPDRFLPYPHRNLLMDIGKGLSFCYCLVTTKNTTIGGPFHDPWYTNKPCASIPVVPVRRLHVLFVSTAVGEGTGVPAVFPDCSVLAVIG
ncbi:hypothetical protein SDC9_133607 [bioreactor metagenome]|uniref:Uncharacterized protein n=1 Tax=bioreactor metagenome TaxID=1076179 RepID=A0A645DBX3_9ZZZZ